ncbi:hypothetical protein K435DRAFT_784351 [Dendrothele bispora CBS 962.96]|uniref:Uncharacterized protein n=1 Tax=Dendrothele bispora (strain CBS 962.96) TaxID=1314807 RepID=A0A4S8L4V9_DENBC|nr:hypothetical protein K435DRAFT_784351 [Dendrothele bispora CBS 962.96]
MEWITRPNELLETWNNSTYTVESSRTDSSEGHCTGTTRSCGWAWNWRALGDYDDGDGDDDVSVTRC